MTAFLVATASTAHADVLRLSFMQALDRAQTRSPQVLSALQDLQRAEARAQEVMADALPSVSAQGALVRTGGAGGPVVTATPATSTVATLAPQALTAVADLNTPVVAPRRWLDVGQARQRAHVAGLDVAAMKRESARAAAAAYLDILQRRREIELRLRARDTARAHSAITGKRLASGAGSRLDDIRARQEVEIDEQLVVTAELNLLQAQEWLGLLLGTDGPVDATEAPGVATGTVDAALEEALRLRADLIDRRAKVVLARRVFDERWADYAPWLALDVSAGYVAPYRWPTGVAGGDFGWQLALILQLPLYDGGKRGGLARERSAAVRQAELDLENGSRQARVEIRLAHDTVQAAGSALDRIRAAAALAHEAVAVAELAYRAGATTDLELIDAERHARDVDTAVATEEHALCKAQVDFAFAAGALP